MQWRRWVLVAVLLVTGCRNNRIVGVLGTGQIPAVNFGRVIVGETATAPFSVENIEGDQFDITAPPALSGTNAGDFAVVTAPATSVRENSSVSGQVSFSPQDPGARAGALVVDTDSSTTPVVTGQLTGVGVAPETITLVADPPTLIFGQVEILISRQLPLRITNTGSDPAPLMPLRITSDAGTDFVLEVPDGGVPAVLAPGASLDLAVDFTPPVLGEADAALEIQACQRCAPLEVPLSGIGFAPGLVFVPSTLSFSALRGQTQTLPVQITNQGNATAEITNIVASTAVFQVDVPSTSALHLAHGDSYSFTVTYAPPLTESPGTVDQAQLSPIVNAANQQGSPASLTGTVLTDCELSTPAPVFFGYAVPPNALAQTVSISNAGADACDVTAIGFTAGSDSSFELSPSLTSLSLPAGGDAGIGLRFSPADANEPTLRQATLELRTSEAGASIIDVPLSGYTQDTPYDKGSPWPRHCHDNGNTCLSDVDTSRTTPTRRWVFELSGTCGGEPVAFCGNGPSIGGDGTIYAFGYSGYPALDTAYANMVALDPSGRPRWAVSPPNRPYSDVVSWTRPVQATIGAGELAYLVDNPTIEPGNGGPTEAYLGFGEDGGEVWDSSPLAEQILSDPFLRPDGTALLPLFVAPGSAQNGIGEFIGGTQIGLSPCPGCTGVGVVAADNTSYWLDETGSGSQIFQLLPDGGQGFVLTPNFACGGTRLSLGALMLEGSEIFASASATLADGGTALAVGAFNLDAGLHRDWQYCALNTYTGKAAALNPDAGVILAWETTASEDGGASTGFSWIDPPGIERWRYALPMPRTFQSDIAVGGDGSVYFTSQFASLVALNPGDGTVRWAFDGGADGTSPPAIGADGTIYFEDKDALLNAVR